MAEDIFDSVNDALLVLDGDLIVQAANRAYCRHFRVTPAETVGQHLYALDDGQWDIPALRLSLEALISDTPSFSDLEVQQRFAGIGQRIILLHGRRLGASSLILLMIEDVTEQTYTRISLKEKIDQYRALIRASSDVVYRMSADWSEMKELVGRDFIADTKKNTDAWLAKYIHPEDQAEFLQAIEAAIRTRSVFELTHRVLRPDRSLGWTFSRAIPIVDANGELVEWLGTARDITALIEEEQQCLEREERFRTLAELSPLAILVNVYNRWVYANQAAAKLLGASDPRELVGLTPFDVICPEYHDLVRERIRKTWELGQPAPPMEYCWRRLDGTPVEVEVLAGLSTWDGQPAAQVIVRDITERKGSEKALKESEQRLQQLADAMPQLVWTVNANGEVTYFNTRYREFRGLSRNPDGTWGWEPLIHPDDLNKTMKMWASASRSRKDYQVEHRIQCADGSYRWFLTRAKAVLGQAGEVVKWIGTTTDIDTLKTTQFALAEAKAVAEEASLAKSDFVANMSHEIRTPMTVFLSALEFLLENDISPEQRKILHMADKAANTLRSIIDNILDFSRIEARKVVTQYEPFDLRACVNDVVDMFTLRALEKRLTLASDIAADIPVLIIGDQSLVSQILVNLVGNAIKFTDEGTITIFARPYDHLIEFAVADTGPGIPDEKLALIFDSFCQADTSFNRRYGGSGLGLAICKGLVELLGGEIMAANGAHGGAVFTFTLPLGKPEDVRTPLPGPSSPPVKNMVNRAVRILLAEDDPMIREVISLALAEHGWHVAIAENGEAAVDKWRHGDYDVVLMDIQLPKMNGLQAAGTIRSTEPPGERTVIIGFTAHVDKKVIESCLDAGMDRVLSKPVSLDELYRSIEHCLATT